MTKKNSNRSPFFKSSAISLAVLVGFLCIQFHSFSHIDLGSLSDHGKTHQTENASPQISGHSSSDKDIYVDCADCVLTKHLQASIEQDGFLFLSNASGFLTVYSDKPVFESQDYLFHLRAPPFYVV